MSVDSTGIVPPAAVRSDDSVEAVTPAAPAIPASLVPAVVAGDTAATEGVSADGGSEDPARASDEIDRADEARAAVLREHGAEGDVLRELLEYTRSRFRPAPLPERIPLDDEPFVAAWEEMAAAGAPGLFGRLREWLVQLRFPIAPGMGETPEYQAATRRGELPAGGTVDGGLALEDPDGLDLRLRPTPAGRVPVLIAATRGDFEALVRALTRRNEPAPVPASQGACIVGGYNDWGRVHRLRRAFEAAHPVAGAAGWAAEWKAVIPRKELYQDRFILLSRGPYSGVPAGEMGMDEADWLRVSLAIRLEHECCHYVTRRLLGSMRNTLHDEVIADWAGIRAAAGRFRASWLLRFLGVEGAACRPGGRLSNYRGDPRLSDRAFAVLCRVAASVAACLERLDGAGLLPAETARDQARTMAALAAVALEELAGDGAEPALEHAFSALDGRLAAAENAGDSSELHSQ